MRLTYYSVILFSTLLFSCGSEEKTASKKENSESSSDENSENTESVADDNSDEEVSNTVEIDPSLPVVKAVGGEGTNVNWSKIKGEADPEGPGYFYFDCDQGVKPLKASSSLTASGNKKYGIENLNDFDPMTAWVEGKEDYGIGEYFEIQSMGVNVIYNGYQSTPQNWKDNSRVKLFKVYRNSDPLCYLELKDEMGRQQFELPGANLSDMDAKNIYRFEIVEVYPGDKWKDVAISHIDIALCCFSAETNIASGRTLKAKDLNNGLQILSYDPESGNSAMVSIEKWTKQKHLSLIEIKTNHHTVKITSNHPLLMKDLGYVSIDQAMEKYDAEDLSELVGKVQFGIFDPVLGGTSYESMTEIKKIEGEFETYTIQQLSEGNKPYIINGFITQTY